jgi:hypothetical protein
MKKAQENAQALLELAVFGTILLMLLGVLLYYGLHYNNSQKFRQRAFRGAMAAAAVAYNPGDTPMSATYVMLRDKHIPDPQDPWGIGFVSTVSASATSPTRTNHLEFSPDTRDDLPRIIISIQGVTSCPSGTVYGHLGPPCQFLAAGFRTENNVREDSIKRYRLVYGGAQGCESVSGTQCTKWGPLILPDEEQKVEEGEDYCDDVIRVTCPGSSNTCSADCAEDRSGDCCIRMIRYIDSAEGEIVDRDTLIRQCRMIVDRRVCRKECNFGKKEEEEDYDCTEICAPTMNIPWYCANYTEFDTLDDRYVFPVIDNMFILADAHKAMALQPDYIKRARQDNELRKREDAAAIVTRDTWDWNERTEKAIIYKRYHDRSGNAVREPIVTRVYKDETQRWTTPW